jgi:hypothetical protein
MTWTLKMVNKVLDSGQTAAQTHQLSSRSVLLLGFHCCGCGAGGACMEGGAIIGQIIDTTVENNSL